MLIFIQGWADGERFKKPEPRSSGDSDGCLRGVQGRLTKMVWRGSKPFNLWRSGNVTMRGGYGLQRAFCFGMFETGRGLLQRGTAAFRPAICKAFSVVEQLFHLPSDEKNCNEQTIRRRQFYKLQRTRRLGSGGFKLSWKKRGVDHVIEVGSARTIRNQSTRREMDTSQSSAFFQGQGEINPVLFWWL